MNDKITVCLGKGGQREMAESFARKNNVSIMDKPGEHLTVMFDSRGVFLLKNTSESIPFKYSI